MASRPKIISGNLDDLIHGFNQPSAAVYVITNDETGAVKIGVSGKPGKRNLDMQVGNGSNLATYWAIRLKRRDAYRLEAFIHGRLRGSKYHQRGEWYKMTAAQAVWFINASITKLGVKAVPDLSFGTERHLPELAKSGRN